LPEEPQHLVISNPEEFEAFEVEPDTLKQMRNVCDSITAPFEDFDFVVEALLDDGHDSHNIGSVGKLVKG